jgi:SAM-dependent methyltransferase
MLADGLQLPFAARTFSLVVALGVVPWLQSAQGAVDEVARVLRPGGYVVLNASNRHRLSLLLDPWHWPAFDPLRTGAKRALAAGGVRQPAPRPAVTAHGLGEFDEILLRAGLQPRRTCTFGFGPFSLLRFPVMPDRLGVRVNARFQQLADRGLPGVRRAGNHYLVLARRS